MSEVKGPDFTEANPNFRYQPGQYVILLDQDGQPKKSSFIYRIDDRFQEQGVNQYKVTASKKSRDQIVSVGLTMIVEEGELSLLVD